MARIYVILNVLFVICLVKFVQAACPTGCTCSSEIACSGLDSLPPASELFDSAAVPGPEITIVSITGSPITEIPDDYFTDLPEFTTLSLRDNGLTSLSASSFKYLPKFNSIDLTGNPLVCGDDFQWMKTWLAAGQGDNTLTGFCPDGVTDLYTFLDSLNDKDAARLAFSESNYDLGEDDGVIDLSVNREGDTSIPINFRVQIKYLGATNNDFTVTSTQLALEADQEDIQVALEVIDNEEVEPEDAPRRFVLTLIPETITVKGYYANFTIINNDVETVVPDVNGENGDGVENEVPDDNGLNGKDGDGVENEVPDDNGDGGDGDGTGIDGGALAASPNTTEVTTAGVSGGDSKAWVIIIVIFIIVLAVIIGIVVWKKMKGRKQTTSGEKGGYAAVQGEGDSKVYNATTEEIA